MWRKERGEGGQEQHWEPALGPGDLAAERTMLTLGLKIAFLEC